MNSESTGLEAVKKYSGSCNAYLFGDLLIDAPCGIKLPKATIAIITHEHCDHFAGIDSLSCEKAAGPFCAEVINEKRDGFGLCSALGMAFPESMIKRILHEGDRIEGDGIALEAMCTPGHARGAICLLEPDSKLLFPGDTVFPGFSMPNCALPTSEPEKLIDSYERLASLEIRRIFPGHGGEIRDAGYISKLASMVKSGI